MNPWIFILYFIYFEYDAFAQSFPAPLGALSVGSCVSDISHQGRIFLFFSTFLLSAITRCMLICTFPSAVLDSAIFPRILVSLHEQIILKTKCGYQVCSLLLGVIAFRSSQLAEQESICVYTYLYIYTYLQICPYVTVYNGEADSKIDFKKHEFILMFSTLIHYLMDHSRFFSLLFCNLPL